MRQSRHAQLSISGATLNKSMLDNCVNCLNLSDEHPIILTLIKRDFINGEVANTGACGLGMKLIFAVCCSRKFLESATASWHSLCLIRPVTEHSLNSAGMRFRLHKISSPEAYRAIYKYRWRPLDAAIEAAKRFWAGILCNTRVQ